MRVVWRWSGLARAGAALCACAALGVLLAPRSRTARLQARARCAPDRAAHALADFNNHHLLHTGIGKWWVEEEGNNGSSWWYSVGYECGAGCAGEARVWLRGEHAGAEPRHAAPREHRVRAWHRRCRAPALPAWPASCEEEEVETVVSEGAAGAAVVERLACACGVLDALGGACAARAERWARARQVALQDTLRC